MESILLAQSTGGVTRVTLNRPESRNALDEALVRELTEAFTRLSADESVRAVVLTGGGPAFCSGADLEYMARAAGWSRERNLEDARALERLFGAIAECPKATIARVHGAAIGGGIGLLTACDIVVAAEDTKLAFSEVRLGLAPATIAPYVIDRIGIGTARFLFVSGGRFSALDARRIGLVDALAPPDQLDAVVGSYADEILEAGPEAIAATKALLRRLRGMAPAEAADTTSACIADLRAGAEAQERIAAFLEGRKRKAT